MSRSLRRGGGRAADEQPLRPLLRATVSELLAVAATVHQHAAMLAEAVEQDRGAPAEAGELRRTARRVRNAALLVAARCVPEGPP